jgi:hypothetical protein
MFTCPDCAAVSDDADKHVEHAETCPIGRGIEEVCANDRLYFELNAGKTERKRPPHWAEVADLKMMDFWPDIPGEVCGDVVVRLLGPGLRARRFDGLFLIPEGPPPKDWKPTNRASPRLNEEWSKLLGVTPPAEASGGKPPFRDLPDEIVAEVERVLEEDTWAEVTWDGAKIILMADTYLERSCAEAGKDPKVVAAKAWSLENDHGRRVYVWSSPRGSYGMGKPMR